MKWDSRLFGKRNVTSDRKAIIADVIYFMDFSKKGDKLTIEAVEDSYHEKKLKEQGFRRED